VRRRGGRPAVPAAFVDADRAEEATADAGAPDAEVRA
jgi:hypothetical protein